MLRTTLGWGYCGTIWSRSCSIGHYIDIGSIQTFGHNRAQVQDLRDLSTAKLWMAGYCIHAWYELVGLTLVLPQ